MTHLMNCRGKLLDLSTPVVMGILNITPDSFYDGGKNKEESDRKATVEKMLLEGAAIIDLGAVSTRPGAEPVSQEEEWSRLKPVLAMMQRDFPQVIVSVDTQDSTIAERSLAAGASIINDISAGRDEKMFSTVAAHGAPYIMMHMQGTPQTMQVNPVYEDVTREVLGLFSDRIFAARKAGIKDIVLDPGFGFGKTVEHNFRLLKDLKVFSSITGLPVLAGISRKSMINKTLNVKAADALNGTTACNMLALQNGASILRVHDVKEAMECVKIFNAYRSA